MILRDTNTSQTQYRISKDLANQQESQIIRLNQLRNKRKQLQQKLKMVANRIGYRKKKQQEEIRKFMKSSQQVRAMSQTKNFKKFNELLKQQRTQKTIFEGRKKAKEVEDFRITNSRRLSLIYQSVKDKKNHQSQKLRQSKKNDQQIIQLIRQQAILSKRQKHDQIQKQKQRQSLRKKCYWLQKKLNYQQRLADETEIYQKQIQQYYKKIQKLRINEQQLREQQQKAAEALKSAQQNYSLLKQS